MCVMQNVGYLQRRREVHDVNADRNAVVFI